MEHVSATEEHFSAFAMGTATASIDDKQAPLMMVSTLSQIMNMTCQKEPWQIKTKLLLMKR